METLTIIPKKRELTPDQDFQWLRKEGMKYIESLASDLWTDYNVHDPGITILESLCYAITELGYRTDFPIVDLLTESNGKIGNNQTFYTARDILTCKPPLVFVIGKALLILGMLRFCSKYNFRLTRLFKI